MDIEKAYENLLKQIAQNIKAQRDVLGISQEELAHRYGASPRYIQMLESGTNSPSLHTLLKTAKALGIEIQDLFR
ncbi:MAG TPA: helix-turn-helix transcriptional regulator [Oligoflexus sp.]|uniref:helix-turn-helix domain-containing protein n=1 Tax=Oligoflexus sp. TaxID=1971216 RepID=UPI002D39BF2E|nr:helix-turn-helix transcriptional regulator [Oligoflexus sp.]HYX36870.1 helix-turn-helix transcriptional regulator [Oligoflexus sp.]